MKKYISLVLSLMIFSSLCFLITTYAEEEPEKSGSIHKTEYEIFPENYARYGDHWYLLVRESEPWGYAKRQAENAGGVLCCISDKYEQEFIELFNKDELGLWLGAIKEYGAWTWLSGEEWTYEHWAKGFPLSDSSSSKAALRPDKWCSLGYDDTYLVDGFLVEFDSKQACLDAAAGIKDGSFLAFRAPFEEPDDNAAPYEFTRISEHEDPLPFPLDIAVIAILLFLIAAAIAAAIIVKSLRK